MPRVQKSNDKIHNLVTEDASSLAIIAWDKYFTE
jgi:hypothetical protein